MIFHHNEHIYDEFFFVHEYILQYANKNPLKMIASSKKNAICQKKQKKMCEKKERKMSPKDIEI